jgi:hypothetical protein
MHRIHPKKGVHTRKETESQKRRSNVMDKRPPTKRKIIFGLLMLPSEYCITDVGVAFDPDPVSPENPEVEKKALLISTSSEV